MSGKTRRTLLVLLAVCVPLFAAHAATAAPVLPPGFEQAPVATSFSQPTAFAYTPDGRIFVAEKAGRVRVVNPGTRFPQAGSILNISGHVNSESDRGLLGIAVDKDYATNHYVYLLYTYEHNPLDARGEKVSKLTRVKVGTNNAIEQGEVTILGKSPLTSCPAPDGDFANDADCIPADYLWHTIGTVRSDPVDGTLWVGTGDAQMSLNFSPKTLLTQNDETYRGKILHVDRNGNGLSDHPFCPGVTDLTKPCTKIYAKGFRNPFRFTLRGGGKGPVVGDVGADDREEVDLLRKGGNYGWPCYEGTIRNDVHESSSTCQSLYAQGAGAVEAPVWEYPHLGGEAVAAGPQYSGSSYPSSYTGDVFVADFARGWMKRLKVDADDELLSVHEFATFPPGDATPVDLQQLPNGDVGYLDIGYGANDPGIYRFRYTPTNASPVARASGTPLSGAAPLTVSFDARGSSDPDGDALSYSWNFGDGTTGSGAQPSHTYTQTGGNHTATVTVTDGRGGSSTAAVGPITPGNTPPSAAIEAPATFRYGQSVTVTGGATDPQDGSVPATRLNWTVQQVHGNHTHAFTGCSASASCTFNPGNDHDADSYFKVTLTATDSNGSTDTELVEIRPQTIQLTLASSPSGVPLQYSTNTPAATPRTYTAAIGFASTVIAPEVYTVAGQTYNFRSWSDFGARQHVYPVPATSSTLTASYNGWPTAYATSNKTSGDGPLSVAFDASPSTDPEGDTLTYAWAFGDGTTGTGAKPTKTYAPGEYTPKVTVTDGRGGTATRTLPKITVADKAPVVNIAAPTATTRWTGGTALALQGTATDAVDGARTPTWRVVRKTGTQSTQVFTTTGTSASFQVPTNVDADTSYEVTLSATDSAGNSTTSSPVVVEAKKIQLGLSSAPAGANLRYGGHAGIAPFTRTAAAGFQTRLAAPVEFSSGGHRHTFESWSDGATAADRAYTVPAADTTVTARYNGWPIAGLEADRTQGTAPLDVKFTGSATEPDGDPLTYDWQFGDNTPRGSGRTITHRFAARGTYTVVLTVADGRGGSDQSTVTIRVGEGPTATIDAPAAGTRFTAGQQIALVGHGSDDQGTPGLVWNVDLHRAGSVTAVPVAGGRFTVPLDPAPDWWYEATLTATDVDGLTATDVLRLDPQVSEVALASDPPGAPLTWNGTDVTAPSSALAVVGTQAAVAAPASFDRGGSRWLFGSWSNGGAREQSIAVPAAGTLLTARFDREAQPPGAGGSISGPPQGPGALQPQQPVAPQQSGEQPARVSLQFRLAKGGLRLGRNGTVAVKLRNRARSRWRGKVDLASAWKLPVRGRARKLRFARRSVTLEAGTTKTVKLRLSARDRRLVGRLRRVPVTLTAGRAATALTVLLAPERKR